MQIYSKYINGRIKMLSQGTFLELFDSAGVFNQIESEKCWHWPIFPARRQASIFGSAQLNLCVRNGYRWTLCDSNTNFFVSLFNCQIRKQNAFKKFPKSVYLCWHWPIFPDRRQSSIFGSAQLNFCVRNGYRWTLCDSNTNCRVALLPYFAFIYAKHIYYHDRLI